MFSISRVEILNFKYFSEGLSKDELPKLSSFYTFQFLSSSQLSLATMDLIIPNQLNGKTPQQKKPCSIPPPKHLHTIHNPGTVWRTSRQISPLEPSIASRASFHFYRGVCALGVRGKGNSIIKPARNISSSRDATDHLGVYDFHTALATPLQLVSSLKISITFI